jgi:hypothetical protein
VAQKYPHPWKTVALVVVGSKLKKNGELRIGAAYKQSPIPTNKGSKVSPLFFVSFIFATNFQ